MSKYFDKDLFGERLAESMRDNNDTTYSLAEFLHLSPSAISRYTTGDNAPKIPTIDSIAKKYGVNPGWLMGTEGVQKYPEHKDECKKIPVIFTIAAGAPILAQENIENFEYVPSEIDVHFCLRVKGDSMIGARILDGDLVFIRQQKEVENGEIAAVLIDGEEATLKRFFKADGKITLRSENPNYPDLTFTKNNKKGVVILGKAIRYISEVR
ncbi:LexA family protein [Desulfosporosinus nitroreducens]|uniref:LexA family protein n=1 Tax=Desulfosporosinus nitroreducens TaxID=2018668 RepID=UPI00207D5793|nr:S24 family peptidase [Desulfosporosinus nitroreducens]MCO1599787.1 helix-turn-helix domain-containing protein [Desulfosporosinus nitroreducens]